MTIISLEDNVRKLSANDEYNHIYFAFNNRPNFRRSLRNIIRHIGTTLQTFTEKLCFEFDESTSYSYFELTKRHIEELRSAQAVLDEEYTLARKCIYYECHNGGCQCSIKPMVSSGRKERENDI